jgi:hypothetical protein
MNHTRLPQEILLREWARRDMQGTKADRVKRLHWYSGKAVSVYETLCVPNTCQIFNNINILF